MTDYDRQSRQRKKLGYGRSDTPVSQAIRQRERGGEDLSTICHDLLREALYEDNLVNAATAIIQALAEAGNEDMQELLPFDEYHPEALAVYHLGQHFACTREWDLIKQGLEIDAEFTYSWVPSGETVCEIFNYKIFEERLLFASSTEENTTLKTLIKLYGRAPELEAGQEEDLPDLYFHWWNLSPEAILQKLPQFKTQNP